VEWLHLSPHGGVVGGVVVGLHLSPHGGVVGGVVVGLHLSPHEWGGVVVGGGVVYGVVDELM